MSYDELKALAGKNSDHQDRIIAELEPALKAAPKDKAFLEIGNRDGGSAVFIMANMPRGGELITCDINPAPSLLNDWVKNLDLRHTHFQMSEESFFEHVSNYSYGFTFLDAEHGQLEVTKHVEILKFSLVVGAILVVDDVGHWPSLPEFDGLERVEYNVDEGDQPKPSGHHVIYYRKV